MFGHPIESILTSHQIITIKCNVTNNQDRHQFGQYFRPCIPLSLSLGDVLYFLNLSKIFILWNLSCRFPLVRLFFFQPKKKKSYSHIPLALLGFWKCRESPANSCWLAWPCSVVKTTSRGLLSATLFLCLSFALTHWS